MELGQRKERRAKKKEDPTYKKVIDFISNDRQGVSFRNGQDVLEMFSAVHGPAWVTWIINHDCCRVLVNHGFHLLQIRFPSPLRLYRETEIKETRRNTVWEFSKKYPNLFNPHGRKNYPRPLSGSGYRKHKGKGK